MPAFEIVILLGIAALFAFQIWLTVRVWKSGLYERKQKIMQAQLIWLLPIVGAGLVFSILHEDAKHAGGTTKAAFGKSTNDKSPS